jgi:hypothetical protein
MDGTKTFEGLLTGLNEYGEIRLQHLVQSTSHKYMENSLKAMVKTLENYNLELPKVVWVDKCCVDRAFLEKVIPSLTKRLDAFHTLPMDVTPQFVVSNVANVALGPLASYLHKLPEGTV